MRREEIPTTFLNKYLKLVKNDGFCLNGYIRIINETNLLFETEQAKAMISLDAIRELVIKNEGR